MAEHAAVFVDVETPITVRTNTAEKMTVQNDVILVFGSMIQRLWADGGVDVQSIWRFRPGFSQNKHSISAAARVFRPRNGWPRQSHLLF